MEFFLLLFQWYANHFVFSCLFVSFSDFRMCMSSTRLLIKIFFSCQEISFDFKTLPSHSGWSKRTMREILDKMTTENKIQENTRTRKTKQEHFHKHSFDICESHTLCTHPDCSAESSLLKAMHMQTASLQEG